MEGSVRNFVYVAFPLFFINASQPLAGFPYDSRGPGRSAPFLGA
jgi:hypothetical protein